MPDWSVWIPIGAKNGLAGPFAAMIRNVVGFGSAAAGAFAHAERRASAFTTFLKAQVFGTLISGAIRSIGREIRQLPQMLGDFASRAEAIGIAANTIGITADAFQRLAYAASITDVPVDTMSKGMEMLNKNMGQLTAKTGPLFSIMSKVNPALARQLRTVQDSQEAFLLISDAITGTTDTQTRAAIATTAFGKSGQDLLPMLLAGRTGLQKLMAEASKYASLLSNKVVAAGGLMDDTLTQMRASMTAVKETVLSSIMFAFQPYVARLSEWIASNKEIIAQKIESVIRGIVRAGRWLVETFRPLVAGVWEWYQANKVVIGLKIEDVVRGITRALHAIEPAIAWIVDHPRSLLAVALAWKGVAIALGIARAAQLAMNLAAAAGGAAAAAGAVAPAVAGGLGPVATALMASLGGGGGLATAATGAASALSSIIPVVAGIAAAAALVIALAKLNERIQTERDPHLKLMRDVSEGKVVVPGVPTGGTWQQSLASQYPELTARWGEAPNAAAVSGARANAQTAANLAVDNRLQFQVDTTATPGVGVRIRPAPVPTGTPGSQYVGAR